MYEIYEGEKKKKIRQDLSPGDISSVLLKMEAPQQLLYDLTEALDSEDMDTSGRKVHWSVTMATLYKGVQMRRALYLAIHQGTFAMSIRDCLDTDKDSQSA